MRRIPAVSWVATGPSPLLNDEFVEESSHWGKVTDGEGTNVRASISIIRQFSFSSKVDLLELDHSGIGLTANVSLIFPYPPRTRLFPSVYSTPPKAV